MAPPLPGAYGQPTAMPPTPPPVPLSSYGSSSDAASYGSGGVMPTAAGVTLTRQGGRNRRRTTVIGVIAAVVVAAVVVVSVVALTGNNAKSSSQTDVTTRTTVTPTTATTTTRPRPPQPPGIPVVTQITNFDASTPGYGLPTVVIRLGNSGPLKVLVDTGSVGLRVLASALPTGAGSGITPESGSDNVEYGDGTMFTSRVDDAILHIGRIFGIHPVAFAAIEHQGCAYGPAIFCPNPLPAFNVVGIMGIGLNGLRGGDPFIVNPLLSLGPTFGRTWSIGLHVNSDTGTGTGILTLRAPIPSSPTATFQLERRGQPGPFGAINWDDYPYACWTVGVDPPVCEPTLFDTGTEDIYLQASDFPSAPTGAAISVYALNQGTQVALAAPLDKGPNGTPFWNVSSGYAPDQNEVFLEDQLGLDITGVAPFFTYTVTYDIDSGTIWFSK